MNSTLNSTLNIIFIAAAFIGMAVFWEFVAWFMHKYVMHGFGWYLHEDHHKSSGKKLQKNDLYALFFAFVSFLLIFNGLRLGIPVMASAGFGVALYGIAYVLFHDILFHKRIRGLRLKVKNRYLKRIINSHRIHHSVVTKDGASNFSFLWAAKAFSSDEDRSDKPRVDS